MSAKIPPLHALRAFEAAARLGSFAKAAEELCITRSAVSHRIQLLEDLLGEALFQREARALALTARGVSYLALVRKALDSLQELALQGGGRAGLKVTVATPPTFARMVLMPRLPDFQAAHPDIELALQLAVPLLDLAAGDTDVEIRFGTGHYPDREAHLLLDEPVFPVASPAYLEQGPALGQPADLQRAQLLRSTLEPWAPWFAAAGLNWGEPTGGPRFEDLALLYQAAAAGQGVALARATLVRPQLEGGELRRLFDIEARSPHAYYLVYRSQVVQRPEVAAFVEWLRGAI
ncbi:MAG: transcriptional regulator GcvA [Pseudomonadota bacterium]